MFISGEIRNQPTKLDVRNPYTGQVVGEVSDDSLADCDEAIELLKSYNRGLTPEERKQLLVKVADAVEERRDEFAQLITAECGVSLRNSNKEVTRACGNLRVAAEEAIRLHGESLVVTAGDRRLTANTVLEPVGVVCAITPFNRPLNQVVVKVAPALAANNSIIVKPSEKTPLTALLFASLLHEMGCPSNMVAVVTGDPDKLGPALVSHSGVDMVTFTGGVATGEKIAANVGLKKIAMELGGNDPLIVLEDADLVRAAKLAANGAFATSGQSCRGVKRVIVIDSVADQFVELLQAEAKRFVVGDPSDPDVDLGTLITEEAASMVASRCSEAVADGATMVFGGGQDGAVMEPTVLDNVSALSTLVQEETMGPVAPVIRVHSVEEAIEVSNGTVFGLQAGVMTSSIETFATFARQLNVGAVNLLEGPNFASPHIPFGGVKKSGIGREGTRYAMREMSTIKTVVMPI